MSSPQPFKAVEGQEHRQQRQQEEDHHAQDAEPHTESMSAPDKDPAAASSSNTVAEEILTRLTPFLTEQHLEIEARLCNFSAPELSPPPASSTSSPRVLRGSYGRIQVGVSAGDFTRMKTFVELTKQLPMRQGTTKDINTERGRYTYTVNEDGTETYAGCIEKKRLCNVEVAVPGCKYDIRLSVSIELPRVAATAPTEQPRGYVRVKQRWTATEASYEYAFTSVSGHGERNSNKSPTFEVEVEGVNTNAQTGVTKEWLSGLVDRLLAMAQLEGNTGLPKDTFAPGSRPHEKRPRPQ